MRTYSDEALVSAVANARSWRGVLRDLDLSGTSSAAMRSVRHHADRLGLDYDHFRGQRRWTEAQLAAAVASSSSWAEVVDEVGLMGGSATTTLRGHALRLALPTAHLDVRAEPGPGLGKTLSPQQANLSRAGSLMAAAWFELCGCAVAWPLEPSRNDLLVSTGERVERIQVKTTTVRSGLTSWTAKLATTGGEVHTYGPDEIDQFFVINGDHDYYLIPLAVVGGLKAIRLAAYESFRLDPSGHQRACVDGDEG